MISVTNSFTNSLIHFAKKDKNFVVLDADLSDDLNLKNSRIYIPNDLFRMVLLNKI